MKLFRGIRTKKLEMRDCSEIMTRERRQLSIVRNPYSIRLCRGKTRSEDAEVKVLAKVKEGMEDQV